MSLTVLFGRLGAINKATVHPYGASTTFCFFLKKCPHGGLHNFVETSAKAKPFCEHKVLL